MKATAPTSRKRRANYGIEKPRVVRNHMIFGAGGIALGASIPSFDVLNFRISLLGPTLTALGVLSLGAGLSCLAFAFRGKFNIRDRMLNTIEWRGNEAVLDIGTGYGLLAIGAAKRLTTGTATGIDTWTPGDTASDPLAQALKNAAEEGVEDKVEFRPDDPCNLVYVDRSFDTVLSLLDLHAGAADVAAFCLEIARVLKPGGKAVIAGRSNLQDYARALTAAGLRAQKPRPHVLSAYVPLYIVVARKP